MIATILIIVLILALIGALPSWGYMSNYAPSGIVGVILVVVVILWLLGRL